MRTKTAFGHAVYTRDGGERAVSVVSCARLLPLVTGNQAEPVSMEWSPRDSLVVEMV